MEIYREKILQMYLTYNAQNSPFTPMKKFVGRFSTPIELKIIPDESS